MAELCIQHHLVNIVLITVSFVVFRFATKLTEGFSQQFALVAQWLPSQCCNIYSHRTYLFAYWVGGMERGKKLLWTWWHPLWIWLSDLTVAVNSCNSHALFKTGIDLMVTHSMHPNDTFSLLNHWYPLKKALWNVLRAKCRAGLTWWLITWNWEPEKPVWSVFFLY